MIRQLTIKEELDIIDQLEDCDILGEGSSRCVYDYEFEGKHCVVKIAVGRGGFLQSRLEQELFDQYGNDYPVAKIFAAGKCVEIMEYVDDAKRNDARWDDYFWDAKQDRLETDELYSKTKNEIDFMVSYTWRLYDENRLNCPVHEALESDEKYIALNQITNDIEDEIEAKVNEMIKPYEDVTLAVSEICGFGGDKDSDVNQVGTTEDGRIVCYDYGLASTELCGKSIGEQVDDMDTWVYDYNILDVAEQIVLGRITNITESDEWFDQDEFYDDEESTNDDEE